MEPNQNGAAAAAARRRTIIFLASVAAVLVLLVAVVVVKLFSQHAADGRTAASGTTTTRQPVSTTTAAPTLQGVPGLPSFIPSADLGSNCRYPPSSESASKPVSLPKPGKVPTSPAHVAVTMNTTAGNIALQLANNESPCTVHSFVNLAQNGFFDNTSCHRLTTSPGLSVLQCGDPGGDGTGGPGYQFADEYPTDQYPPGDSALRRLVVYPRGTLAMANGGPNTNGSQFFLVYRDSQLPPQYTVFGTIGQGGLATLDQIARGGVAGGGQDGSPVTDVTITSVRVG